jgi:superfamily II DNA or RNA helicase
MKRLSQEEKQWLLHNFDPAGRKEWVQNDVFKHWTGVNRRGTFEGATGIGKTRIGIRAVKDQFSEYENAEVWIIVPTATLRDTDWPAEFRKWGAEDLLGKVHIICYASISRMKPKQDIDLLILDEVHHLTPKATTHLFHLPDTQVYNILGLTATMPRTNRWEEEKAKRDLIDQYAPSFYKVSLEDGIELELIADFEVHVLKYELDNKVQNKEYGGKKYTERTLYQHLTKMVQRGVFSKKPGLKAMAMQKRTQLLRTLGTKVNLARIAMGKVLQPGKRTLIFCGSIEQCNELCGERVYHSQTDDKALIAFQAEELDWMGVVNALNEGKNVNNLDQSLIVQLDSSERNLVQRIGRNVRFRPGHKAKIYVLVVAATVDEQWYKSAFAEFDKKRIREYMVTIE